MRPERVLARGGCLVTSGGQPVMTPQGPVTRVIAAPASSFELLDTWHSTGLCGSGSNDYQTRDLFVPPTPERDTAVRLAPVDGYPGIELADVKPREAIANTIVEGVY